jgi:hypothetical protein
MRILKLAAFIILLTGLFYIIYGALTIYLSSWDITDLPARYASEINNDIRMTGATWERWQRAFFNGGAFAIGLGIVTVTAGIGIIRTKSWGRTIWLFLSPILMLFQFAQGQKSVTKFNTQSNYKLAFLLLIIITSTWLMLLLPSSRTAMAKKTQHRRRL